MEGSEKYFCVFDSSKPCEVKKNYKLKPESLVEFCKICNLSRSNQKETMTMEALTHIATTIVTKLASIFNDMSQIQKELGKKTAEAEIYKKLYVDSKSVPPES